MIIDFETYSAAGYIEGTNKALVEKKPGLSGVGLDVYVRHPTFDIICLAYDSNIWSPRFPWSPEDLFEYVANGGILDAHNSMFEYRAWNSDAARRYGFPPAPLEQFRCTAARARSYGLPGALAKIGDARNLPVRKSKEGDALIKILSVPQTGGVRCHDHQKLTEMYRYCVQDIAAEQCVYDHIPPMRPDDEEVWLVDQRINDRGVHIDMPTLRTLKRMAQMAFDSEIAQLITTTQGMITSPAQVKEIAKFCGLRSVKKEIVEEALASPSPTLTPDQRAVLQIRQRAAGAAAKKLWTIEAQVGPDDRLRNLFVFAGAERTGRWSAVGPQPQNLKSGGPDYFICSDCQRPSIQSKLCPSCGASMFPEAHEWSLEAMEAVYTDAAVCSLNQMVKIWGDVITVIGSSIRGLFTAAQGYRLVSSDYSAIEAVVLACLAGEQWRIDVFKTHGKIYEASAAKAFGLTLEEILDYKRVHGKHHPLRKKGKVRELANGYGGWIGANRNFGATGSDAEIKEDILKWRDESPNIVEFWGGQWRKDPCRWEFYPERYGLEGAAINAMENPYKRFQVGAIEYCYEKDRQVLLCKLPSGRQLVYHYPRLVESTNRLNKFPEWQIRFMGYNTDSDKGPVGWIELETYAGKLTENVTQAVANDILRHATVNVEKAGYPIVLTVHDELVCECPEKFGSVSALEFIMSYLPEWARGWPVVAKGGWEGKRFRK